VTPGQARERFATARVATLATVDTAGAPHLVPVTFAVDGDTIVSAVDGKPKRDSWLRRHENIRSNPAVSLLVQHWDEDWSRLWWVRAGGTARVTADPSTVEHAVALLRRKYEQYQTVGAGAPLIVVTAHAWRGWSGRE
jgi:PPOX class probable F420-dependent enzyme